MADTENKLAGEFISAARACVGRPFWHHYKPADLCAGGTQTGDECMRRGMDWQKGYDCSGLVIASMCDVLGIAPEDWPLNYRHLIQLETMLAVNVPARAGDLVIMHGGTIEQPTAHIGISALNRYIHASGKVGYVVEGLVRGAGDTKVVALTTFAAVPSLQPAGK